MASTRPETRASLAKLRAHFEPKSREIGLGMRYNGWTHKQVAPRVAVTTEGPAHGDQRRVREQVE